MVRESLLYFLESRPGQRGPRGSLQVRRVIGTRVEQSGVQSVNCRARNASGLTGGSDSSKKSYREEKVREISEGVLILRDHATAEATTRRHDDG